LKKTTGSKKINCSEGELRRIKEEKFREKNVFLFKRGKKTIGDEGKGI